MKRNDIFEGKIPSFGDVVRLYEQLTVGVNEAEELEKMRTETTEGTAGKITSKFIWQQGFLNSVPGIKQLVSMDFASFAEKWDVKDIYTPKTIIETLIKTIGTKTPGDNILNSKDKNSEGGLEFITTKDGGLYVGLQGKSINVGEQNGIGWGKENKSSFYFRTAGDLTSEADFRGQVESMKRPPGVPKDFLPLLLIDLEQVNTCKTSILDLPCGLNVIRGKEFTTLPTTLGGAINALLNMKSKTGNGENYLPTDQDVEGLIKSPIKTDVLLATISDSLDPNTILASTITQLNTTIPKKPEDLAKFLPPADLLSNEPNMKAFMDVIKNDPKFKGDKKEMALKLLADGPPNKD